MNTDGKRRQGRFLKKSSKLIDSVDMHNFSFSEIAASPTIQLDNPDRSIVHAKFHDTSDLEQNVKAHQSFDSKLSDPNHPELQIIFPQDFTEDWKNEKLNAKRRSMGYDDDDEADMPLFTKPAPIAEPPPQPSAEPVSPASLQEHGDASEETISRAIKVVSHIEATTTPEVAAPVGQSAPVPQEPDNFVPLDTSRPTLAAEDRAIEMYRKRHTKEDEETLNQIRAAAEQEGYKAGFQAGEEKGALTVRQDASQLFAKVNDLLKEFADLKHNILNNIQKNFYELNQAIAESLLEREFSIEPEAFANVIRRAIADTVMANEFKIKIHPKTFETIAKLDIVDLLPHITKDLSVQPGEFRLESNLTVVDVNAKKLIKQMLDSADTQLFEHKEAG